MTSRFAIYFAPPPDSVLAAFGRAVLGYDIDGGVPVPQLRLSDIGADEMRQMTHAPARYGFHATLKAPFRLRAGRSEKDLQVALGAFGTGGRPASIGRLSVQPMGAFVALRPTENAPELDCLAAACVESFDDFREPAPAEEIERRRAAGLTPRQDAMLERWGYPYVLDEYRFHLTLAGPLPEERRGIWRDALTEAFAALADTSWTVDAIAVVRQGSPDTSFRISSRVNLPA